MQCCVECCVASACDRAKRLPCSEESVERVVRRVVGGVEGGGASPRGYHKCGHGRYSYGRCSHSEAGMTSKRESVPEGLPSLSSMSRNACRACAIESILDCNKYRHHK